MVASELNWFGCALSGTPNCRRSVFESPGTEKGLAADDSSARWDEGKESLVSAGMLDSSRGLQRDIWAGSICGFKAEARAEKVVCPVWSVAARAALRIFRRDFRKKLNARFFISWILMFNTTGRCASMKVGFWRAMPASPTALDDFHFFPAINVSARVPAEFLLQEPCHQPIADISHCKTSELAVPDLKMVQRPSAARSPQLCVRSCHEVCAIAHFPCAAAQCRAHGQRSEFSAPESFPVKIRQFHSGNNAFHALARRVHIDRRKKK